MITVKFPTLTESRGDVVATSKQPFLSKQVPSGAKSVELSITGGTVAWNQQGRYLNRRGTRPCFGAQNATVSAESERSMTLVNTGNTNYWWNPPTGHKILATFKLTQEGNSTNQVQVNFGGNIKGCGVTLSANVTANIAVIGQQKGIAGGSSYDDFYFYPNGSSGSYVAPYTIADFNITDLTQMLGSTLADYIYTLESGTAGAGIAKLKEWGFFTKDYYDYDAGTLMSVKTSAHDSYPLDDIELRGIPKKDADNNLYYDGDTYESDGTVTRKYGTVTFNGTESWTFASSGGIYRANRLIDGAYNVSGTRTPVYANNGIYASSGNPVGGMFISGTLQGTAMFYYIPDQSITTEAAFKTWLASHPLQVLFQLATETTETADPYENPQNVGTVETFTDTRDVPIPVGVDETYYEVSEGEVINVYFPTIE